MKNKIKEFEKIVKEVLEGTSNINTSTLNGWHLITPSIAEIFLTRNVSNFRPLSQSVIDGYAADMAAGHWKANGDTIVFSTDRILRNGQHRLKAIIKSGKTILTYVIFDAPETEFYDSGYKRSVIANLRDRGIPATSIMTGIARIIVSGGPSVGKSPAGIIDQYVENNFDYLAKAQKIICTKQGGSGRKAACGAIAYCMLRNSDISESELTDFFSIVNSQNSAGVNKDPSSALVLSKQLSLMRGGGKANQAKQLEYTIKAIEDFHSDITRKRNYTDDSHNAERLIKQVQELDKFKFQVVA
jgi:hypothetical protein